MGDHAPNGAARQNVIATACPMKDRTDAPGAGMEAPALLQSVGPEAPRFHLRFRIASFLSISLHLPTPPQARQISADQIA